MRQFITDKATELLEEMDELGTVDNTVYVSPIEDPTGGMTMKQLLAQQKRENQSGRWQAMLARHWLGKAMQEKTDEKAVPMLVKGIELFWEAKLQAKSNEARLTSLPEKGGRPRTEDIDILIEMADDIRSTEGGTIIAAARKAMASNQRLQIRYGECNDDYIRKKMREQRKENQTQNCPSEY